MGTDIRMTAKIYDFKKEKEERGKSPELKEFEKQLYGFIFGDMKRCERCGKLIPDSRDYYCKECLGEIIKGI